VTAAGVLTPAQARRVLMLLSVTRWFPVGVALTTTTLLPVERGLSVAQTLTLASVTGLVVFALELPTAGAADALGRRPVLLAAAGMQVLAASLFASAQTFWGFAAAAAVTGAFRALDSGPLEAWFVDTVHATRPGADVDRSLSQQGTVLGVAIAVGALVSGGLVWWHPMTAWSALTLPYVVYAGLAVVHLVAVAALLREPRPPGGRVTARGAAGRSGVAGRLRAAATSAAGAPRAVADGLRLVRGDRVLLALLLVEVFAAAAMVVFESFQPLRLGELLGSREEAGAVMGPVASVGWAVFALGSGLAGLVSGRLGVARTALAARVLNGAGAVAMGLVAGPAALVAAYLVTYGLHGSGGPLYSTLLHRQARAGNRATVLSLASMTMFVAYSALSPALGALADTVSTPAAMVAGGAFSVLGAVCFVPALRREKELAAQGRVAERV
jgi:MFS family permease